MVLLFVLFNHTYTAGLPSLVPIPGSLGPVSSNEDPFGANIHNRSHHKINSKMIAIIALSAVVFVLTCFAIGIIWRFKGLKKSHATGPFSSSSITRKGGKIRQLLQLCCVALWSFAFRIIYVFSIPVVLPLPLTHPDRVVLDIQPF